jgi:hypothetical protein
MPITDIGQKMDELQGICHLAKEMEVNAAEICVVNSTQLQRVDT